MTKLTDGPIINDEEGNLPEPVPHCTWNDERCQHVIVRDFQYYYCSAQPPEESALGCQPPGKRLYLDEPNANCPYLGQAKNMLVRKHDG